MEFLSKEIILGLNVQEFLLHLLNFAILVTALYFLLYKPVRKFMAKRDSDYRKAEQEYQDALKGKLEAKEEGEKILSEAREEAVSIAEEAHALAMVQTQEVLESAKEEAKDILVKAKEDSKNIYEKEKQDLYYSISDLAVNISEKLIERELTEKDNDLFIDSIIKDLEDGEDNA